MSSIRINNIDCYYEIHGNGSPLILIAGLASDSQSWHPIIGSLTEYFKVVVFDNRGIGRTRYPQESFQISTLALDTVCLLDELAIKKADILGHSMGGYIAQEIAIEYPERVNRLILANTCASTSQRNKLIFNSLLKTLGNRKDYELFIRELFCLIFTVEYLSNKDNIESAVKSALHYHSPVTPEGFKLQVEALSNFSSLDRLSKIKAATLLMAGRKDIVVTLEESQLLADKIPFVQTMYLENSAHSFQVEQPDLFVDCVVEFLLQKRSKGYSI
ncbi:MAG: alpha/beta hydrolase [Candidatus Omnitrophica bacterium]|nr:alpha/beta hydrolase [Candidatus Omnitrophota bacterium]